MKVRTLQVVEDANEFSLAEVLDVPMVTPWTLPGSAIEIKVGGQVVGMKRVDRFPEGVVVDLPARQAQHLIDLELAEVAP